MYLETIPTKAPPTHPEDEFTLRHALKQEVGILAEYTGLYGFIASSAYQAIFPGVNQGKDVYFQGSRQMDNFSRRYYERELGAGIAPSPSMKEHFGYTEPFRRFVQREDFSPQANPLRNQMPGWLPGADYLTNFHIGDPFTKVDEGYARLPGAGYEALHPELKGLNPEDYPDINKLAILGDVAPLLSRVQHLPFEGGRRLRRQHRAAHRVREDPRPCAADPGVRHPDG
jgi:hypothetical protein